MDGSVLDSLPSALPPPQTKKPAVASPAPSQDVPFTPENVALYLAPKLGLTHEQALGIGLAGLAESGGNPQAANPAGGGQGAHYGFQWRGSRLDKLHGEYGQAPNVRQQLDFLISEAKGGDAGAVKALALVKNAKTPQEAKAAWEQYFERPGPVAGGSPGAQATGDQYMNWLMSNYQQNRAESMKEFAALQERVRKAPLGSADYHKALDDLLAQSKELQGQYADLRKHAPQHGGPFDGVAMMVPFIIALSLIGGRRSAAPATATLQALAGMLQGSMQGSKAHYDNAFQEWKTQSDALHDQIGMMNADIERTLQLEGVDERERLAQLNTQIQMYGLGDRLRAEDPNFMLNVMKWRQASAKNLQESEKISSQIRANQFIKDGKPPAEWETNAMGLRNEYAHSHGYASYHAMPESEQDAADKYAYKLIGPPPVAGMPAPLEYPDKWPGMPDTPPPGIREDVWDTTLFFARTHQMPAMGFAPGMRQFVIQAYPAALHALGIKPSQAPDIQAAFAGERHAEIVGGGRAAMIGFAINEAKNAAPQVIETSKAVPRSQFPSANKFWNWMQEETGSPQIVAFKEALRTYLNVYASAISRTGRLTDTQQNHAYELLSTAFNQGQIERGIAQLNYEMLLMQGAVAPTMREMQELGKPPALQAPPAAMPPSPAAVAAPGATAGGIPVPAAQMSDPDGTKYHGSDGRVYVKHGAVMVPQQ